MYSSRGNNNGYGQQQQNYSAQAAYAQNLGADGASQLSMAARHSAILGGSQEADIGYRAQPSAGAHYGGQYSSVYGSAALSSAQQAPPASAKGAGPSALEGRSGYGSTMLESPKFTSGDYVSSTSHGYGQKGDHVFAENLSDYKSLDRRQYAERTGAYIGRDLQSDPAGRFADSISFGHQHQPDLYDRIDQASVLRQEHMLKAQAMQSSSIDGGPRQADYLAVRGANIRRQAPELMSYSGRMEADPHSLSMLAGSSHGAQHAPSILGAAPRRDVDDLAYAHSSSNPGYGVSLPPGRDYATGKGLHGSSLDPDYPGSILARGGYARIDDRKDDRGGYARELERREEERRRELLREREKDREREKERERERDRERERKRERERILERREKEKERDRKRGPEVRRERTPPRISRDRGRSSSTKGGRSLRRESPRVEASHRRHSPVKEKRREYACKVYSSSLVDIERDYLSMDRRYPRLFVSPECSKVVVNWPRENLKIPFYTPVSFEHDFIEEETASELKTASTMVMTGSPAKPERASIQWNAKIIFMSGLSQNALEELSSERSYDDRIPHFCNMLRFAILKKENSFMTIGGPWDSIDGADPSVDNSSLVQTALRYANGVTQLDLKNCQHWNPFLEIHYDRLGKDGLFSHKEITVLYIPDLSECLPSIDAWRDQWLANKKAIAERERLHALKKEKSREKDDAKDREAQSKKDPKKDGKSEKNKDSESAGNMKEKDGTKEKEKAAIKVGDEDNIKVDKIDMVEKVEEDNDSGKKNQLETAGVQAAGSGKKKIVRRVVKKVAAKKNDAGNAAKPNDKLDVGEKNSTAEVTGQEGDSTINSTTVKTFTRKKITKKGVKLSVAKKQDEGGVPEILSAKEPISFNEKPEGNSDPSSEALVLDTPPKTTVKKKIIKRVAKKKVVAKNVNEGVTSAKDDNEDREKVTLEANEEKTIGDADADANNQGSEAKSKNKTVPKTKSKTASAEKQESVGGSNESKNKGKNGSGKEEKRTNEKSVSGSKMNIDNDKQKVSQADGLTDKREKSKEQEKSKDGKERKDRDGKAEPKSRDTKEKKKHDEPPRHPGLFLQTKGSKDSRLHSLSLSLDSLLDYTDKDIEESTFELSLFAETLYEMLQYQMGSRLLTFLQKLRIKFMAKRNERKRQREESLAKESEKASASKRVKTEDSNMENKTVKTETLDETRPDDEMAVVKREDTSADKIADVKVEDELDEEEDPDEDPEEDEEMAEPSIKDESENEENVTEEKVDTDAKSEDMAEKKKDEQEENAMETSDTKHKLEGKDGKEAKVKAKVKAKAKAKAEETKKKETPVIIDKELLQAFRFFDRNRVGYIRVEDLRLILHNLGKFMSHRDVKEIVQSALLESNTGRDDRILYNKLVRMPET